MSGAGTNEKDKLKKRGRVIGATMEGIEVTEEKSTPNFFEDTNIQCVGIYARVSTDSSQQTLSYEMQQKYYTELVARHPNWRLIKIYADEGKTGTSIKHRAGFNSMIKDCNEGKITLIITKDLTRFGRNAIDAGYYIEQLLPAMRVRFIAITDSYDSIKDDGNSQLPLKNMIAETYARDISRKCRSVQRQNIADGRFVGRMAPYGYSKHPNDCRRLVVDEEAAAIV
ncbi:MAG: recombinase family protein, partial [Clostridiales bacterium]|nr:recombinase family protein [Clostridiales bacterium]